MKLLRLRNASERAIRVSNEEYYFQKATTERATVFIRNLGLRCSVFFSVDCF